MSEIKLNKKTKDQRTKRIPFGSARQKMHVPPVPGYSLRWINDEGGRILQAQQGGYEFHYDPNIAIGDAQEPSTDLGTRISKIVGKEDGRPIRAYLMKIRLEFYKEDQDAKEENLRVTDDAIKRGKLQPVEQSYVPKDSISFTRK